MRVCFVTPSVSRAGYGLSTALQGTTAALQRAGCDVTVVSGRDRYSDRDVEHWRPVPVHTLEMHGPASLSTASGLGCWFRDQLPFDVISMHGVWSTMNVSAIRYAQRTGARTLLTPQGMLDPWAMSRSRWKKKLARLLYADYVLHSVGCMHVFSDNEALAVRGLGLRAPMAVIPNGVDANPREIPRERQPAQRTLLFLGRLHVKKGIRELIEAWNTVGPEATDWRLIIAGPDELGMLAELKRIVRVPNLEFVGEVLGKTKEDWLRTADAFVLPSHSEGLPMAVLEAWSHGAAVVMTAQCNIPAGFEVGAALRVEPERSSIAQGLRTLVSMSGEELEAMGLHGRRLVESHYSWDAIAAELLALYQWLCGSAARPRTLNVD